MTQHEYVFVALSIILGLALTRMLHTVAQLIRARTYVSFHWSTAIWGLSVLAYVLQLWWVGWGLRDMGEWMFIDFLVLVLGCISIYGAAEMAMPVPGEDRLDMLSHSQHLGRLSALSMLVYFLVGPYVNIFMYDNPILPSLIVPGIGVLLTSLVIAIPRFFPFLSLLFALYSIGVLLLTT
ncbi:MAG: hypothetical protein V7746_02630 [Halioglobus sp.]